LRRERSFRFRVFLLMLASVRGDDCSLRTPFDCPPGLQALRNLAVHNFR